MAIFPALPPPPDLDTQFEDLLHLIYEVERRERQLDRIDAAIRIDEMRREREERERRKGA